MTQPTAIEQGIIYNDGNTIALMAGGREVATIERHAGISDDDFGALLAAIAAALNI